MAAAASCTTHEQQQHEEDALLCLQTLFLDGKSEQIWKCLLSLPHSSSSTPSSSLLRQSMQALFDMVQERATSAERYSLIHALLLYTRQTQIAPKLWSLALPQCNTPSYDELCAAWPGRGFAIPQYALDKHTRRGGTGGAYMSGCWLSGEDTWPLVFEAGRYWSVDVALWSPLRLQGTYYVYVCTHVCIHTYT